MNVLPNKAPIEDRIDASLRLQRAIDAIELVRDLCTEITAHEHGRTLAHSRADQFAALFWLMGDELRIVQAATE